MVELGLLRRAQHQTHAVAAEEGRVFARLRRVRGHGLVDGLRRSNALPAGQLSQLAELFS